MSFLLMNEFPAHLSRRDAWKCMFKLVEAYKNIINAKSVEKLDMFSFIQLDTLRKRNAYAPN